MTIKVRFHFKVDTNHFTVIIQKLKSMDVNIKSFENDPSNLIGTVYIPTDQPLKIVDLMNSYYVIEGVISISPYYESEGDKKSWYKHTTIGILIRTVIVGLTIFGILYGLNLPISAERFWIIVLVPTVISFFSGISNKYF